MGLIENEKEMVKDINNKILKPLAFKMFNVAIKNVNEADQYHWKKMNENVVSLLSIGVEDYGHNFKKQITQILSDSKSSRKYSMVKVTENVISEIEELAKKPETIEIYDKTYVFVYNSCSIIYNLMCTTCTYIYVYI